MSVTINFYKKYMLLQNFMLLVDIIDTFDLAVSWQFKTLLNSRSGVCSLYMIMMVHFYCSSRLGAPTFQSVGISDF